MNDPELRRSSDGLRELDGQLRELDALSQNFSKRLLDGLVRAGFEGKRLDSVFKNLALQLSQLAVQSAFQSISSQGGGASAFSSVLSGIVGAGTSATSLPVQTANGSGAATFFGGGSGPGGAGGGPTVVNISTPDARSFRQAEGQVTAALARAVRRGQSYF